MSPAIESPELLKTGAGGWSTRLLLVLLLPQMVRRIFREITFLVLAAVAVSAFCTVALILTFWFLSLLYWPER